MAHIARVENEFTDAWLSQHYVEAATIALAYLSDHLRDHVCYRFGYVPNPRLSPDAVRANERADAAARAADEKADNLLPFPPKPKRTSSSRKAKSKTEASDAPVFSNPTPRTAADIAGALGGEL